MIVAHRLALMLAMVLAGCCLALSYTNRQRCTDLRLKNQSYRLEVASTMMAQQAGLSGRKDLNDSSGMLFTFTANRQLCFWMKNMRFPLDILWLDSDHSIVAIEPGISPSTYPTNYCHPGRYVIELSAGQAAKNDIKTGQKLQF